MSTKKGWKKTMMIGDEEYRVSEAANGRKILIKVEHEKQTGWNVFPVSLLFGIVFIAIWLLR